MLGKIKYLRQLKLLGVKDIFIFFTVVKISCICAQVNVHQILYVKYVNLMDRVLKLLNFERG